MIREMYTHTRNYGCRLRRYLYNGVEMLSLENRRLKAVVALGKGADIVELVYKPMDVDFMWHSFNPLGGAQGKPTVAASGGTFMDSYAGGWQDLFPTYGARATYNGAEIGVHGEACIYPWECRVVRDEVDCVEVCLSLRTRRSPFRLEKTLRLCGEEPALQISQEIVNEGGSAQSFMWGQHPAFGAPFLDESVRLRVPGEPEVLVPESMIAHRCPFAVETRGKWPLLPGKDGKMIDMSRAYPPESRMYMEYLIDGLSEGRYELVNENLGLGLRMTWDIEVFPHLWVWALYRGIDVHPWYGRSYVLALEPWSSFPANFEQASRRGDLLRLEPGERLVSAVRAEAFCEP